MDDEAFRALQVELMKNPSAGDVIEGTAGLRKVRLSDGRSCKGKRSGLRLIYFWWNAKNQFWLFTLDDKDEATELTPAQRAQLKVMLKAELEVRK